MARYARPSVDPEDLGVFFHSLCAPEVGERGARRLMPIQGKNIWRLCKTYGRLIGAPELKPHDLRHGVAMEVLQQHHDLEQVRALLGHTRVDTTQIYATIRPAQLKRAVAFYEDKASRMMSGLNPPFSRASRPRRGLDVRLGRAETGIEHGVDRG